MEQGALSEGPELKVTESQGEGKPLPSLIRGNYVIKNYERVAGCQPLF
jgi:hypothetical protein